MKYFYFHSKQRMVVTCYGECMFWKRRRNPFRCVLRRTTIFRLNPSLYCTLYFAIVKYNMYHVPGIILKCNRNYFVRFGKLDAHLRINFFEPKLFIINWCVSDIRLGAENHELQTYAKVLLSWAINEMSFIAMCDLK